MKSSFVLVVAAELSLALDTCRILPCNNHLLASCVESQCTCTGNNVLTSDGERCEAAVGGVSLGDRLVLENNWIEHDGVGDYVHLPLTSANATSSGWTVSPACVPGFGVEASNPSFANGLVNIYFQMDGTITGYEVRTPKHKLNHDVCKDDEASDGSRCAILFRRQSDINCDGEMSDGFGIEVTSIGDRLLFPYWEKTGGELPLNTVDLLSHSPPFIDAESCLANMGHHYVSPMASTNPVIPMYYEKSGIIGV